MTSRIYTESPAELFEELVGQAIDHQQLHPSPASTHYLVQLLDSFVRPDGLFSRAEIEPDRPLAEIFCVAVESGGLRRFLLLKLSGDLSLFLSGILSDSLKRRAVDVDYYGRLGGTAYATAAGACHSAEGATLFGELADNFGLFVDVLNEVSEICGLTDHSDLLRLAEKWRLTHSRRCAAVLANMGMPLGRVSEEIH